MSSKDIKRARADLPVISATVADLICRAMLPLAENADSFSERLTAAGFSAHIPWQKFFESFASAKDDLEGYRTYRVETAKNAIGRPWPRCMFDRSVAFFFSEHVKALFEARDRENGVDEREISVRYSPAEAAWRWELNACDRRRMQFRMQHREEYERLYAQAAEMSGLALRREVERLSTQTCARGTSDSGDQVECYVAAMESHATQRGFRRDAAKSKRVIPIFSKEIAGDWDLCWAMEEAQLFVGRPAEGLFTPYLQLRSRRLAGSSDAVPYDRYLTLRIELIVPEFLRAYQSFSDLDTLEALVRARLTLYDLLAPTIEGTIRRYVLQ